jgi:hypothetical protein
MFAVIHAIVTTLFGGRPAPVSVTFAPAGATSGEAFRLTMLAAGTPGSIIGPGSAGVPGTVGAVIGVGAA